MPDWAHEHVSNLSAAAVVVGSVVIGLVIRWYVQRRLVAWAARTAWRYDDALVQSLRRPILHGAVLAGLAVAASLATLPETVEPLVEPVLLSGVILTVTLWVGDLSGRLLARSQAGGVSSHTTGVIRNVVRIAVFLVGAMVLLGTLGISITPVLTTLGIGGLAVALGLQETLSNIFAGIHITLARNIRPGDFVRLETGEEGTVEDIGWRAARVRVLANNAVIIPNSRLAQSIVINFDQPSKELAVLVDVGVHYASDLERVERVTIEVAAEVMRTVAGGVADFQPFIRYNRLNDSSIDFTVILRATSFTDNYLIKHEFIKRLVSRYAREGIVIPFPIRALNLDQERAATSPRA